VKRPRPTLELVGDWTSPRLLIRLMAAIDSPWDLTERGLRSRQTGEVIRLEMRGPDLRLPPRFRTGDSPIAPSLTEELLDGVDGHRSVLRIQSASALEPDKELLAVARCGAALANAGAIALWCPQSGVAHAADRWLELVKALESGEDEDREAQYSAWVRCLVRTRQRWATAGMGLLGLPEVAVPPELPDATALETLRRTSLALRRGQPPVEGDSVRPSVRFGPARWAHQPDATAATEPSHNPYGVWWLAFT
jgi:hypothetical protein